MFTGTLTICAVIALLGIMAIVTELVLDRLAFEPFEEDMTDWGEE